MIHQELRKLEADGRPIRVGASGAGWMGSGFVAAMKHVPGMELMRSLKRVRLAWR